MENINNILKAQRYFGRGIIVAKTEYNVLFFAYFLMGRSVNSKNRFFLKKNNDIVIKAYDETKIKDPSLIFYPPVIHTDNHLIIGNGDQTLDILNALKNNQSFEYALRNREFEPDEPNFTPRISALIDFKNQDFTYKMSILKSMPDRSCARFFYEYKSISGYGHFIHTYARDEDPLPSFVGEPKIVKIPNNLKEFGDEIWNLLYDEYKVCLSVQSIDLKTKNINTYIYNLKE